MFTALFGPRPKVPYLLSDMAADAVGLLDALGVERAHVVGASMGGAIGQEMAMRHPERLRSLTSIMSTTGAPTLPPPTPQAMRLLMTRPPAALDAYVAHYTEVMRVLRGPGFEEDEAHDAERGRLAHARGLSPDGVARQLAAIIGSGDRSHALRSVQAPTLVIHGDADPLVRVQCGIATAAAIPGAKLLRVPGMGHDAAAAPLAADRRRHRQPRQPRALRRRGGRPGRRGRARRAGPFGTTASSPRLSDGARRAAARRLTGHAMNAPAATAAPRAGQASIDLPVTGMSCASCVGRVEKALAKVPGVESASVNLATEKASVVASPEVSAETLADAVRKAGYDVASAETELAIEGMTCASCVARVEKALAKVPGVVSASVNLATERATVRALGAPDRAALVAAVEKAGYAVAAEAAPAAQAGGAEGAAGAAAPAAGGLPSWWPVAVAAALTHPARRADAAAALRHRTGCCPAGRSSRSPRRCSSGSAGASTAPAGARCAPAPATWTCWWRSAPRPPTGCRCGCCCGRPARRRRRTSTSRPRRRSSRWCCSASGWRRARARQTADAIRALNALRPATARVRRDGAEAEVPVGEVRLGETVLVRAGERIPVDGEVAEGRSHADESLVTGESLPVAKAPGDRVTGGSINAEGALTVTRHRRRRRDDAGAHHPHGRVGAGGQGADPARRRQGERGVRAGGARHRRAHARRLGCLRAPAGSRRSSTRWRCWSSPARARSAWRRRRRSWPAPASPRATASSSRTPRRWRSRTG